LNRNANIILEIEANKRKDQLPRDNELFRRDPMLLKVAERGLPGNTSFNSFPGIIQSIYLDCVENIIADEKKQFTS
jgi:hypothetical protein